MRQTVGGHRATQKTVVGAANAPTGATPKATEAQIIFEVVLSFEAGADLPCDKGFAGEQLQKKACENKLPGVGRYVVKEGVVALGGTLLDKTPFGVNAHPRERIRAA